jgi:hypothetical protein
MSRDVFISHSARTRKRPRRFVRPEQRDRADSAGAARKIVPQANHRAIQQSKVCAIFSPHSNKFEQVLREAQLAVDSHCPSFVCAWLTFR